MQTNNDTHTVSNAPCRRALHASRAALAGAVPHSVIALLARIAMGSTFWLSARTKVDGLLTLKDSTFFYLKTSMHCQCCRSMWRLTWQLIASIYLL